MKKQLERRPAPCRPYLFVCALVFAAITWLPHRAFAQAVVNPTRALFDPSPDHNATDANGTAIVQGYRLEFYLVGAVAPFQTVPLGKPDPDATGTITVDLTTILIGWPVPGIPYVADVAAFGPGGFSTSPRSNTFSVTTPSTCVYTVAPTTANASSSGGTQSVTVTTTSVCAWTAASDVSWLTVSGSFPKSGTATVNYSVAANTTASPRTGTLTIAGQPVTVTQSQPCVFTLSPTSVSVPASGGSRTTTVTTTPGCAWTASVPSTPWITITSGASGTDSGSVVYAIAANTTGSQRTGTLTIASQTVTVIEAGGPPSAPPALRIIQ